MARLSALIAMLIVGASLIVGAAPAAACIGRASGLVCDGPCTSDQIRAMDRRAREAAAIAYGRELTFTLAARDASPATDRAADLASVMLPAVYAAIVVDDGGGGSCRRSDIGEGLGREPVSLSAFAAQIRSRFGLDARAPVENRVEAFAVHRDACNAEVRRGFAAYLRTALPAEQLRELWTFMVPRAGAVVPTDGAEPVTGGSLTLLGPDGRTISPDPLSTIPHIADRKERAAQYLRRHDNGIALMSALQQFWTVRVAPSLERPADLCPAADAAMVAYVGTIGGQ